ncbi:MAG: hypothetical protein U0U70_09790 [Chitinophagaceae bacterium]
MNYYLLDGIGGAFLVMLFGLGLLFILVAILIEAAVMAKMKFMENFKKSLLVSFVANILSMAAGIVLSNADEDLFNLKTLQGFAVYFAVTLVIEFIVMYLMNKKVAVQRTLWVCTVMNLVTYAIAAFLILVIFN